jgi:uncharacterized protein YgbK (DUF1537 family)
VVAVPGAEGTASVVENAFRRIATAVSAAGVRAFVVAGGDDRCSPTACA